MGNKNTTSGIQEINSILSHLNEQGQFLLSVLTDAQGLPIASISSGEVDMDRQAAVVAVIQKSAVQVSKQLGMGLAEEIVVHDDGGQRLICRSVHSGDHEFILAVLITDKNQSYRRYTNSAITSICRVWAKYWE